VNLELQNAGPSTPLRSAKDEKKASAVFHPAFMPDSVDGTKVGKKPAEVPKK
jgi:hypothetical protein